MLTLLPIHVGLAYFRTPKRVMHEKNLCGHSEQHDAARPSKHVGDSVLTETSPPQPSSDKTDRFVGEMV